MSLVHIGLRPPSHIQSPGPPEPDNGRPEPDNGRPCLSRNVSLSLERSVGPSFLKIISHLGRQLKLSGISFRVLTLKRTALCSVSIALGRGGIRLLQ